MGKSQIKSQCKFHLPGTPSSYFLIVGTQPSALRSVPAAHMIGLMHPDVGEIVLDGQPLSKMKISEKDKYSNNIAILHLFSAHP